MLPIAAAHVGPSLHCRHRCSTCRSISPVPTQHVHLLAAHCLRFNPFTATSLRGCTRVDGFGFRASVCEAQLVEITGQTNNMQKTVLVQNEALEWGTTCFPRRAFRLIFGTNTVGSLYKIELVLVPGRLLWYRTKMCPIRNVTQQGALARNCPSKALQARLHPDIKT